MSVGHCLIFITKENLSFPYVAQTKIRVSDPHFFFFADPYPGKNLHADPDPGGIRGMGLGVKGKNDFFF